jgi:hypothetical protein
MRRGGIYVTAAFMIVPLLASIALLGVSDPFPAIILVVTLFAVIAFYAAAFKLRYELNDEELRLRQGIFSAWRISLHSITRVVAIKGHARSIEDKDILLVEAGGQLRMVAAPDPEVFLRELAARAPHLRRYGQELRGAVANNYGIT